MKIPKSSIVIGAVIALVLVFGAFSLIIATDSNSTGTDKAKCGCGCTGECKCGGSCSAQTGYGNSTSKTCSMAAGTCKA